MIGKLRGLIDIIDNDRVLIDVNGVGYVVQCSARTLRNVGQAGQTATLYIETRVREDAITLIGFADPHEQEIFTLLTTVQGVGARVALAILSTLSPEELLRALITGDKTMLAQAEGVGPKLAARLLTELKDKAQKLGTGIGSGAGAQFASSKNAPSTGSLAGDVVSSLTNLGFKRDSAFTTVMALLESRKDSGFDELLRLALQELGPRR